MTHKIYMYTFFMFKTDSFPTRKLHNCVMCTTNAIVCKQNLQCMSEEKPHMNPIGYISTMLKL